MRVVEVVAVTWLAIIVGQSVGVGASCAVILLDTAICNSACDVPMTSTVVSQLQLTGTLVEKVRSFSDILINHSRTLSFRRAGEVLDVNCLAERPGIATVLAVRPFRCVGGDPVGVAFTSYGCSSIVEQQQGKYTSNILGVIRENSEK